MIKTTDFSTQDIEQLSQTFANCESHNPKLQKMYQLMPDMMRKTQNEKIGKKYIALINGLSNIKMTTYSKNCHIVPPTSIFFMRDWCANTASNILI